MGIYHCANCPLTLTFFTDASLSNVEAWTEVVYRAPDGRVGFQVDSSGQAFLRALLTESWAFDRGSQSFKKVDAVSLNIHNLHNQAAIVAIQPREKLVAEFVALSVFRAAQNRNIIRARLGQELLTVARPQLSCCMENDTRKVPMRCVESIARASHACLLMRASEYGLSGALIAENSKILDLVLKDAATASALPVVPVNTHDELPLW